MRSTNINIIVLMISFLGCNLPKQEKPLNAIIVLVDDMGYGDIAAHGNPILKTPNFDKLHDVSARFTNFAVSPTCAPTRAAIMTGSHEFLVGVTHTITPEFGPQPYMWTSLNDNSPVANQWEINLFMKNLLLEKFSNQLK